MSEPAIRLAPVAGSNPNHWSTPMTEAAKVYHAACPTLKAFIRQAIREQSEKLAALLGPAYEMLLKVERL